jgi:excinuclease ABC subunit A
MHIRIEGAAEHNLKDVDVEFGDGLTVVTGVSGSGKTSLVFDTLYHEAHRRFVEVFSLGSAATRLSPAKVRSVTGISPAVAVGQNLLNRNPGSTLASASGLHPFFRLLYARFGERHCTHCGSRLTVLSDDTLIEQLMKMAQLGEVRLLVPLVHAMKGSHTSLLRLLQNQYDRETVWVDGNPLTYPIILDPAHPHDIDLTAAVIDSQSGAAEIRQVIASTTDLGSTAIKASRAQGQQILSRAPVCASCGAWFEELDPVDFHTPCPYCMGKGCAQCFQTGMVPQAAAVTWQALRLTDLLMLSVDQASEFFHDGVLPGAARLEQEITRRLKALTSVGLGYINLDRSSPTLSRGEAQRVRLAVALTSRLEDMLHVLDEPTIGQHPADVSRLLLTFRQLAGPVVFVEHDRAAAATADHAVDIGPGAGSAGGQVIFQGTPSELWQADTPTGRFFSLRQRVFNPQHRSSPQEFITIHGASLRNLQNIDVPIPLGRLTVITGVSGSGKSTLVEDVLFTSLTEQTAIGCQIVQGRHLTPMLVDQSPIGKNPRSNPATYTKLADNIRDIFAEATGLSASHFSFNRPEGACTTCSGMGALEVRMHYLPSTWVTCPDCGGERFSDEVLAARVTFDSQQLSIAEFLELSIAEVHPLLAKNGWLSARNYQAGRRILEALVDVGLGYLSLGQPSPTLSGGEAQRVKLAKYLAKPGLERHLLVLDEPSTGLHPQDISGLLAILDRLVRAGATIVVVEHNTDIIRAADWVIDLGPGAGPQGGRLVFAGPPEQLLEVKDSLTGQALREEEKLQPGSSIPGSSTSTTHDLPRAEKDPVIAIRKACANNLKAVDVDFPKGALTVVTGISGSGKSSLVGDVLEAEARRRFLEMLSMYERQGTHEGPEAPVEQVKGLGVVISISPERKVYERRATVGTATEVSHHLAILLSSFGQHSCPQCGSALERHLEWYCPQCHFTAPLPKPRHFNPANYPAACLNCHGLGTRQEPCPEKLIIHPEKPLIAGAMYSPGFFPNGYLGKPFNGGYDLLQALGRFYHFDPAVTPWNQMSSEAQQAFLFGMPDPIEVVYTSRKGRVRQLMGHFPGFYGWIRDWDVGGTYTRTATCPTCAGSGLRPEYASVTLAGCSPHQLGSIPLRQLYLLMQSIDTAEVNAQPTGASLRILLRRLRFLLQVGLGYLNASRVAGSLSAGEAQRIRLASLLGSGLTSLTVLLDEPTRGLHPAEVDALLSTLLELRSEGNTVIVVEHDLSFIRSADYLIDMGPGAGAAGGEIVARGSPNQVMREDTFTARWMQPGHKTRMKPNRRVPEQWLTLRGAKANNLRGETIQIPMGVLAGFCGVSGSGKSSLVIDTIGRVLAPKKQTTSVAYEPIEPGEYEAIEAAPLRTVMVDQTRASVHNPAAFLGIDDPLRRLYSSSADARAFGLDEDAFSRGCSACGGSGSLRMDMGFLPTIHSTCETCQGSGLRREAWEVELHGKSLPDLYRCTLDQVYELFKDESNIADPLKAACQVGLGYLVLHQPGYSLSGGEAQRLKIASELCRKTRPATLYILDEPTVGQHLEDISRLIAVLRQLVNAGHSVWVIEHHPMLLAACDWLIELGPGGGPDGGYIIASGKPEEIAAGSTPIASYLREELV